MSIKDKVAGFLSKEKAILLEAGRRVLRVFLIFSACVVLFLLWLILLAWLGLGFLLFTVAVVVLAVAFGIAYSEVKEAHKWGTK